MAYPGTKHALWVETDRREREKQIRRSHVGPILPRAAHRAVAKLVIPYIDRVLAEAVFKAYLQQKGYSARIIRGNDASTGIVKIRIEVAKYLRSQKITMPIIGELMNRNYDTIRYYVHDHHRTTRQARYYRKKAAKAVSEG